MVSESQLSWALESSREPGIIQMSSVLHSLQWGEREADGAVKACTSGVSSVGEDKWGFSEKVAIDLRSAGRIGGSCPTVGGRVPRAKGAACRRRCGRQSLGIWGTAGQSGGKLRERTCDGAAGDKGLVESFLSPSNNGRPLKDKQENASRGEVRKGGF